MIGADSWHPVTLCYMTLTCTYVYCITSCIQYGTIARHKSPFITLILITHFGCIPFNLLCVCSSNYALCHHVHNCQIRLHKYLNTMPVTSISIICDTFFRYYWLALKFFSRMLVSNVKCRKRCRIRQFIRRWLWNERISWQMKHSAFENGNTFISSCNK